MRKILLILLIVTLLVGCSVIPSTKPTMTTSEMATRVAVLLTSMPTATGAPQAAPAEGSDVAVSTAPPLGEEIGVIATSTEEGVSSPPAFAPTMDETAYAALLSTTGPLEIAATATPPITMPSATPTKTTQPTSTPGGTPLPQSQITATFTASDPRSLLPVATWTDTMDDGKNWPIGTDEYSAISFQNGFMMLTGLLPDNGWRLAVNDVDNAYFETTAKFGPVCHGMDKWGMMLRSPDRTTADRGYWFNITCDGKLAFQKWQLEPPDGETKVTNLIAWTSNSNIKPGANAVNRLGILAKGSHFTFFINGVQVGESNDSSFPYGGFGILIGARETNRLIIYVDEMSYWLNPPI